MIKEEAKEMSRIEIIRSLLKKEFGITSAAELEHALKTQKIPIGVFVDKPISKDE